MGSGFHPQRDPALLRVLNRPVPCASLTCGHCDDDRRVSEAVDVPIACHRIAHIETCLGIEWRHQHQAICHEHVSVLDACCRTKQPIRENSHGETVRLECAKHCGFVNTAGHRLKRCV